MTTPTLIPKRPSIVKGATDVLREHLQARYWQEEMPGERDLCAQMHISRDTLRGALRELRREGWIKSVPRRGWVLGKKAATAASGMGPKRVGFLSPVPLHELRPSALVRLDEIRKHLAKLGFQLELCFRPDIYRERKPVELEEFIRRQPADVWILYRSTESMQLWFATQGPSCVTAGPCHPGIELNSFQWDFHGIGRHAAGLLLGKGHRRIAFLVEKSGRAGDEQTALGFREAGRRFGGSCVDLQVQQHDGSVRGICDRVDAMLKRSKGPTGLFVAGSYSILTVLTRLNQLGLGIPQEISLISRDDDPFLQFVVPTLSRYSASPVLMAKKLSRMVVQIVLEGNPRTRKCLLVPEFIAGETVSGPPRIS